MITNNEFKERLEKVFGNEYDLSKVNYINSQTKVDLICKKHGKFSALPHNLLAHKGCPVCRYIKSSNSNKRSIEEIIDKCNKIHGFKYDYSLIKENLGNKYKNPIICHEKDENGIEHGVFYQDFSHHIGRKHGCPKCSGNNKLSTENFISRANEIHSNKYDYSKSEVNGTHNKVCIICHEKDENGVEHGEFWQTPNDHFHGQGCPKCKSKKIWDTRGRLTVDKVKDNFAKIHGDEYDYSLFTEYVNTRTKIPVICKKHGVFYVTPNNHLKGRGCPLCKGSKTSEKQRLPLKEVIKRIKDAHGDKYQISDDFEYKNNQDKIKLICPIHGEFHQNPFNLWRGVGCPKCNKSKLENEVSLILDRNGVEYEEQKKFDWLKNFELDFYLPKHRIAIECQGIQHFKPIQLFGGEEQLKQQIIWDDEKNSLCKENGIKIIYYTSNELRKNNSNYKYKLISEKKELINEITQ